VWYTNSVQDIPFWNAVLGALVGGAVTAALTLVYVRRKREPWPELEELEQANGKLAHRVKMLQGRLNQVAPPREGTGAQDVERQELQRAITRADLLRNWRERNRGA